MSGWRSLTLGDVVELQRGYDLTDRERREGTVPVIGSAGQNGWHDTAKMKAPGVTVGRSGASAGVVTYVTQPYWPHNTTLFVKDFKGNDPRFIYFLLKCLPLAALNSGSAQQSLNRNFLYPMRVRVPDPNVQCRISGILGAYDDLIENNRRRVAILEDMARRLFEEWFVRFRFPRHDRLSVSKKDRLPTDWRMGTAGDLIAFDPPTKLGADARRPFVPMSSLQLNSSLIGMIEEREGNSGSKFRNGDTLFARITPCLENGKTGLVRDLPAEGTGFGSTEFIVMRGIVAGPAFTYELARFQPFRAHAQRSMSGATGRQRVRTDSLRAFKMPIPSSALLSRFEDTVSPWLDLVGSLGKASRASAASRDLLLPRLLSGELSVAGAERELEDAA